MAIVSSSFQNQEQINAVLGAVDSSMAGIEAWASTIIEREYDLQNAVINLTDTLTTYSLSNGDVITIRGSGLTTQILTVNILNYHFSDGTDFSLFGSITNNQTTESLAGVINQIIFARPGGGTVTFNGQISFSSLDLSTLQLSVTNIVYDIGSYHFEVTGAVAGDMQSGTIDSINFSSNGMSFQASSLGYVIDPDHALSFASTDDFMRELMSGNDEVSGTGSTTVLYGYAGDDSLMGTSGRDVLNGGTGIDSINGGLGIDTAQYDGNRATYAINKNISGTYTVSGGVDGTDTLINIERLQFSDMKVALDLTATGNAGQAMAFIGTVAPVYLNDLMVRGSILGLFDEDYTMLQLSQLALQYNLLPNGPTMNTELANQVYRNVLPGDPTAEMTAGLVGYIEANGQANFVATVAGLLGTVDLPWEVNLVGLQQTGLEYLP